MNFVPTILAGGDVGGDKAQRTVTQDYLDDPEKDCMHVHARIVLREIGRPLCQYPDSGELMTIVYHALQGMSVSEECVLQKP